MFIQSEFACAVRIAGKNMIGSSKTATLPGSLSFLIQLPNHADQCPWPSVAPYQTEESLPAAPIQCLLNADGAFRPFTALNRAWRDLLA